MTAASLTELLGVVEVVEVLEVLEVLEVELDGVGGQPLLALRAGSEGSWAVRDSAVLSRGIGVGRRSVPVSTAQRAISLADVVVAGSTRELFVHQPVDFRHEAVSRIGDRHTFLRARDHAGASMPKHCPAAASLVKPSLALGLLQLRYP